MEVIKTEITHGNTLSVIDVAGRDGGKWRIPRVIRVVESDGPYLGLQCSNVIHEYFCKTYDARSKKQRVDSLAEALAVFDAVINKPNPILD